MSDIRELIKSRKLRDMVRYSLSFLPDSIYLRIYYRAMTGKWPNLKNPQGYNEKLQWIKLHDVHPEHSMLVDKIAVRKHIEKVLGPDYLIPLLGTWEKGDDIDFDSLPNEFILKCNHDSGSYRIIKDKTKLSSNEIREIRDYYNQRVRKNFFFAGREYPYKNVKGRVLAEKLMHNEADEEAGIQDYKFFCFNGKPKLMLYVTGRQTEKHEDYFDMNGNHLHIQNGWTEAPVTPILPECFEELKMMAATLSKGLTQVRMDFYEIGGKPYFGEYTFFNGGGFESFKPDEWERRLGDWIVLPK